MVHEGMRRLGIGAISSSLFLSQLPHLVLWVWQIPIDYPGVGEMNLEHNSGWEALLHKVVISGGREAGFAYLDKIDDKSR